MNKVKALKILNPIVALLFLSQAVTALLIFLAGDAFVPAHLIGGGCLVLCGSAHLALNWAWVKMQYFKKQ
jgi:membrane-bound ClpP family serine protease